MSELAVAICDESKDYSFQEYIEGLTRNRQLEVISGDNLTDIFGKIVGEEDVNPSIKILSVLGLQPPYYPQTWLGVQRIQELGLPTAIISADQNIMRLVNKLNGGVFIPRTKKDNIGRLYSTWLDARLAVANT